MAGTLRNLSLMLFPQRWDGNNLVVNLLLLPNGDPTIAVGTELPFATAQPKLRASLLPGLDKPAWDPSITPAMINFIPLPPLNYSTTQSAIYAKITSEYTPVVPALTVATSAGQVRKDLPHSWLEATGHQTPNPDLFSSIDGFGCALAAAIPSTIPVVPRKIAWGEILSYALRQPLIAQAMGLMYLNVSIPLTPAQAKEGGWIWIDIDFSDPNNWYSNLHTTKGTAAICTYAARLPALTAPQDVFAAVLFPTIPGNYDGSVLDTAQFEADVYLDGFAKVIHANQPVTADAVTQDPDSIVPGTDAGIQIGWDDEQVTTWMDRQIKTAQKMASGAPPADVTELPFTVLGYRVDVREKPSDPWASLCSANGTLNAAGVFTASYAAQDLCVEPTPIQTGVFFWLPQYFAQWRGRSLVVDDKYAFAFSGGQPPAAHTPPQPADFHGTTAESPSGVRLRYGHSYQFRTRLTDLTGGGPQASDPTPGDVAITNIDFRRHVPPKKVPLTLQPLSPDGSQTLIVDRPSLNYPEMVFAGAADQSTLDALLAITPPHPPAGRPDGEPTKPFPVPAVPPPPFQAAVLDPDVTMLEIIVEAQAPAHDTGNPCSLADAATPPNPGDLDGPFRVIYTWQIPFPSIPLPVGLNGSTPISLTLQPTAMAHIRNPVLPSAAAPTVLPIPTGRNIRLRIRGVGTPDANDGYFGSSIARTGLIADIKVRFEAASEQNLLLPGNIDQQLQAFYLRNLDQSAQQAVVLRSISQALATSTEGYYLQDLKNISATINPPISTPLELLATALNLPLSGETISAPPGKRILFGAQSTLRHTLTQDRSTITFSTQKDLIHHWVVVQRFTVDRDWTWRGLDPSGFVFSGPDPVKGPLTISQLGVIDMPGVVSALSTQQNGDPGQRDTTEIIFFSTLSATVGVDAFPAPTTADYGLGCKFTGPAAPVGLWLGTITVPITDNPRQVPKLVSTGIAESPYIAADDYSSTTQRQRALWFEFDTPPQDKTDSFFLRVMNYGPDPLLISNPSDLPGVQDTPISLDPEPIRKIVPDSANDDAGLGAMVELIPSPSWPLHYLVPLPDAIAPNALDLFGFWTYEIRCGHKQWSTAQGRYGRPFRIAGVQHPCPPLTANVERVDALPTGGGAKQACIVCSADLAQTVLDGRSLTDKLRPQTQIWFLLYAQLRRADGKAYRNLLLVKRQGAQAVTPSLTGTLPPKTPGISQQQSITVTAAFAQQAVNSTLEQLLLPGNTPLSILAVELFNREDLVITGDGNVLAGVNVNNLDLIDQLTPMSAKTQSSAVATMEHSIATPQMQSVQSDPLGAQLGSQRILRTSPLAPVRAIC
jgi:hypothetical protein